MGTELPTSDSSQDEASSEEVKSESSADNKDSNESLDDLKGIYTKELNELKEKMKEAEYKLCLMKKRYEEELTSFNETKIENILRNSGAKVMIDSLRDKLKQKDDMIAMLKLDLESKKKEAATWKSRFQEADNHSKVYWQKWHDTQVAKEKLEAEQKAKIERERQVLSQALNMTAGSSLLDNSVPPPPPVDVPVDEILRSAGQSQQATNLFGDLDLSSSIPPPPPVEVPLNEIMRDLKPNYGQ